MTLSKSSKFSDIVLQIEQGDQQIICGRHMRMREKDALACKASI